MAQIAPLQQKPALLNGAQERHQFDNPTSHSRGAFLSQRRNGIAHFSCPVLLLITQHRPSGVCEKIITLIVVSVAGLVGGRAINYFCPKKAAVELVLMSLPW